jgi:holo-[acyl-carrier protein] synthase
MGESVLGHAREIVEIAFVEQGGGTFADSERRYAESKADPARRLAARWAAKLAAARVLGGGVSPADVEVVRGRGAPSLRLHGRAAERHRALGGGGLHVSLTHGLTHAAAAVVLEAPRA